MKKNTEYMIKNKHTSINDKTGYEIHKIGLCRECIDLDINQTNEEKLFDLLQEQEYRIEYSKNMWDDSPYSERAKNIITKLTNMRNEREDRSEIRSIAIYDYQSKKKYVENCRDNGYELPEYAQYL